MKTEHRRKHKQRHKIARIIQCSGITDHTAKHGSAKRCLQCGSHSDDKSRGSAQQLKVTRDRIADQIEQK